MGCVQTPNIQIRKSFRAVCDNLLGIFTSIFFWNHYLKPCILPLIRNEISKIRCVSFMLSNKSVRIFYFLTKTNPFPLKKCVQCQPPNLTSVLPCVSVNCTNIDFRFRGCRLCRLVLCSTRMGDADFHAFSMRMTALTAETSH